jgi:hypothetical protein
MYSAGYSGAQYPVATTPISIYDTPEKRARRARIMFWLGSSFVPSGSVVMVLELINFVNSMIAINEFSWYPDQWWDKILAIQLLAGLLVLGGALVVVGAILLAISHKTKQSSGPSYEPAMGEADYDDTPTITNPTLPASDASANGAAVPGAAPAADDAATGTVRCQHCGKETRSGELFCDECGKPL